MVKSQEQIEKTLDKVRALILQKTSQSDQLIERCGNMLRENRTKFEMFQSELSHLDETHISLRDSKKSPVKIQKKLEKDASESERVLEGQIGELYTEMQNINSRTTKFFKQVKQLVSDHYGWLKMQKFKPIVDLAGTDGSLKQSLMYDNSPKG